MHTLTSLEKCARPADASVSVVLFDMEYIGLGFQKSRRVCGEIEFT